MPNIREFTNPIDNVQIPQGGAEAFAAVGRRSGQFFHQAGQDLGQGVANVGEAYQQHLAQSEISQGSAALAGLSANLSQSWSDTAKNADPNDPTTADTWRQKQMEPALQGFADNFQTKAGKAWAMDQVNAHRQHFFEKTAADQSTMAGDALVANLDQLKNRASSWVSQDPTSMNAALGLVDNSVQALVDNSPNLSAAAAGKAKTELAQRIKTEIAKSAFTGMADNNPAAALAALKGGQFANYVDGTEGEHYIKVVQHTQEADARSARIEANQEKMITSQNTASSYLSSVADPTTGRITIPGNFGASVLKDPRLQPAERIALLHFGQGQAALAAKGVKPTTDPATYEDFRGRLGLDPDDPNSLSSAELSLARVDGKLGDRDFANMAHEIAAVQADPKLREANKQFTQFTNGWKSSITKSNPLMGGPLDSSGDQQFYKFQTAAHQAWVAAGRDPALLDPKNSRYLGNMVPQFQTPMKDSMKNVQTKFGNAPAEPVREPRQSGESAADYLKRVGG